MRESTMNRGLGMQRGLSLVEVTIMLLVLMLLTSVLAPSIFDFVNDARRVKVKEDCEAIGVSVARLTRDVGDCLKFRADQPCTLANRVDLIYSGGPKVTSQDVDPNVAPLTFGNAKGTLTWSDEEERGDTMEHQLVDNGAGAGPAYPTPGILGAISRTLPEFGLGWRGSVRVLADRRGSVGSPLPGELGVPGRRQGRDLGQHHGGPAAVAGWLVL